jgi:hypothetical protein
MKVLNIYRLRDFDDKERDFFIDMYKAYLELRDKYPRNHLQSAEEYIVLDSHELLATEDEIKVYKRDHIIDEALKEG